MINAFHMPATTAGLNEAIAAAPAHLRPVVLAVRDHRVALLFTTQGAGPFAIPSKPKRAAVLIIGDDMEKAMGPSGFHLPSVRRAIRACQSFAVVSSAPTSEVYAAMSAVAVGGHNAMIIETRIEHEFQWVALVQKLMPRRALIISTLKGGRA